MWSLVGAKLRLNSALCAPSAKLLALAIVISLSAAEISALARDGAEHSTGETNRPDFGGGQSAYAAGRFLEALRIWRPLAESGDPRAAFGLGLLYDLGEGVGQDAAAAFVWYRVAAEAGIALAEFNIAVMYDSGIGTDRNSTEAAAWYASAAVHGIARAEYNLAQLYVAGDGVPRNLDAAKAWYAASAAHGLSAASGKLASLGENCVAAPSPGSAKAALNPIIAAVSHVAKSKPGEENFVELSWVAPAQPTPTRFFVEVAAVDAAGVYPTFSGYSDRSAI